MEFSFTADELENAFADSREFMESLPAICETEWFKEIMEDMRYQGFDPKLTNDIIMVEIPQTVRKTKAADVGYMVAMCCEKGNKLSKILKTLKPPARKELEKFQALYGIKDTAEKDRKGITLARVCLAFPWITCKYMEICRNPPVSKKDMDFLIGGAYPVQMMTGAFAGIIPQDIDSDRKTLICKAYCLYQYKFSKLISAKDRKSDEDTMCDVIRFLKIGYTGPFIPEHQRQHWCAAFGILTGGDGVSDGVIKAAVAYDEICAGMSLPSLI